MLFLSHMLPFEINTVKARAKKRGNWLGNVTQKKTLIEILTNIGYLKGFVWTIIQQRRNKKVVD